MLPSQSSDSEHIFELGFFVHDIVQILSLNAIDLLFFVFVMLNAVPVVIFGFEEVTDFSEVDCFFIDENWVLIILIVHVNDTIENEGNSCANHSLCQ